MTVTKLLFAAAIASAPLVAMSDDVRPAESKTILEIAEILEKDYGPLTEVSFDDGVWEVETYRGDASLELAVDPKTGEVLSEHRDDAESRPPKDSLKLSRLLRGLEDAGHTDIEEVSFERRYWEVETHRDNEKRELHVNARTGEVISDRRDD